MKDIVFVRKYTDREGNEKKEYINLGYIFEKDGRISILMKNYINLSAFGNDKGEVWLSVYDHKSKNSKEIPEVKKQEEVQVNEEKEEDVPF